MYYSCMAMFEIQDKIGNIENVFKVLKGRSRKKLEGLAEMIEIMSAAYAVARESMGYHRPEVLMAEKVKALASLRDMCTLQDLALAAIDAGLDQQNNDNEEIDLGLIELQQKSGEETFKKPQLTSIALSMGLSYGDMMSMPPGELLDLIAEKNKNATKDDEYD